MTGYGRGELKSKFGIFAAELRTLNHKFLEITPKLPNSLVIFDDKVKALVKTKVKRGKIYLNFVHDTAQEIGGSISIDERLAKSYFKKLKKLRNLLDIKDPIKLADIAAFPGVITYKTVTKSTERLWPYVREAVERALAMLIDDREKEGSFLFKDLTRRIKHIKNTVSLINKNASTNVREYKKRLAQRIKELSGNLPMDKGRLEVEVALFAKNSDITEEITRLNNHIANFIRTIQKKGEVGKKLDFISQELHREINTVGSKSSGFNISKGVIEIKTEIEKIREQLKNIE